MHILKNIDLNLNFESESRNNTEKDMIKMLQKEHHSFGCNLFKFLVEEPRKL